MNEAERQIVNTLQTFTKIPALNEESFREYSRRIYYEPGVSERFPFPLPQAVTSKNRYRVLEQFLGKRPTKDFVQLINSHEHGTIFLVADDHLRGGDSVFVVKVVEATFTAGIVGGWLAHMSNPKILAAKFTEGHVVIGAPIKAFL